MRLIEPISEYSHQIQAYRKEFLDSGDSMDGTDGLKRIEDPEKWIELSRLSKNPDNVPEGRVPATQYIFVREEDNKIVGIYLSDARKVQPEKWNWVSKRQDVLRSSASADRFLQHMKALEPQWFQGFFTPKSFAVDKDAEEGIL